MARRQRQMCIRDRYITYTIKDGMLVKEVSTRKYMKSSKGDYIDSKTSEPIVEVSDET